MDPLKTLCRSFKGPQAPARSSCEVAALATLEAQGGEGAPRTTYCDILHNATRHYMVRYIRICYILDYIWRQKSQNIILCVRLITQHVFEVYKGCIRVARLKMGFVRLRALGLDGLGHEGFRVKGFVWDISTHCCCSLPGLTLNH